MARRVRLLDGNKLEAELTQVSRARAHRHRGSRARSRRAGALTRDYLRLWPHARRATIARSGHLGCITQAEEFADLVARFADGHRRDHTIRGDASLAETVREIPGRGRSAGSAARPAGRRAARSRRLRAPVADQRRHDAHEGRVPGGQGADANRLRRAEVQLPRRRPQRRDMGQRSR